VGLGQRHETGGRIELPRGATPREGADDGADSVACGQRLADCGFNRAALHPAYPIKCRTSTQRTQAPDSVETRRAPALDTLENNIGRFELFAKPSPDDRNLRIGAVHCVVFAWQQSAEQSPAQAIGLTLEVRLPKVPELRNRISLFNK
jgi:hypothetical protein